MTPDWRVLHFHRLHRQPEDGCDPEGTPPKLKHDRLTWTLGGRQSNRGMRILPFAYLGLTE